MTVALGVGWQELRDSEGKLLLRYNVTLDMIEIKVGKQRVQLSVTPLFKQKVIEQVTPNQ